MRRAALDSVNRVLLIETIEQAGRDGLTMAQIAAKFDVTNRQLIHYAAKHEDVAHAMDMWRTYAEAHWDGILIDAVKNPKMWTNGLIFVMCNRFRDNWKSQTKLEVTGKDGGPIEHSVEEMSAADRAKRMKELHEQIGRTMQEKLGVQAVDPLFTSRTVQ